MALEWIHMAALADAADFSAFYGPLRRIRGIDDQIISDRKRPANR